MKRILILTFILISLVVISNAQDRKPTPKSSTAPPTRGKNVQKKKLKKTIPQTQSTGFYAPAVRRDEDLG